MSDVLKQNQAANRRPEGRKLDATDRREATHSADAAKAREIVRRLGSDSLPVIAAAIAKVTSDLKAKHGLEEAVDRYLVANASYMREELKDVNKIVGWMGVGHGRMPDLPEGSPSHKVEFAAAWNMMLSAVNEATKVGVHKPHREHPIMLMADLEVPENTPRIITPEHIEWN
jgi:hypothetical protein